MPQVVLVGSDGQEYVFLAKPRDDQRKDARIMEVAGVLNRLFAKEPASRRRNLYLRRLVCMCHHLRRHTVAAWLSSGYLRVLV